MPEAHANFMPDMFYNTYLNMELEILRDVDGTEFSKVTKLLRYKDRPTIGKAHNNKILDTIMYGVEYKYDKKDLLAANEIVENMFAQVYGEGNWHVLLQEIFNHKYDGTEVKDQYAFITTRTGTKLFREKTKGVEVLVQWKDGNTTLVTLKDMKNSYHVHMTGYAAQSRIVGNPEFSWWIWYVLEKRNRVVGNLNSKYWVRTQKNCFKIPKPVQEAKSFGKGNSNTLW